MNTEVAVLPPQGRVQTAAEVRAQVNLIQQVMESVMKGPSKDNPNGVHYGVIPGTDKPTLLKAGAEVLMSTFRIAVEPMVEDLSSADEIRYRVRCVGTHQTSGIVMGTGIGECSSNEEKYKWRRIVCDDEFDATPTDRRRTKFARGKNNSVYQNKQIRTEPADVANTVLKMAKKRALVDFTLTALAASDIFAQDLEDMPEEIRESTTDGEQPRAVQQPKSKSAPQTEPPSDPNKKLQENQLQFIRKKLEGAPTTEAQVCEHFKAEKLEDIPMGDVNKVLAWIGEQA